MTPHRPPAAGASGPATVCEAFHLTAARRPEATALQEFGSTRSLTWREYATRVRALAEGLNSLGVGPGSTVALMLSNRPEFHLVDTATLMTGATPFSIYNTNPASTVAYQLDNAGATILIGESNTLPTLQEAAELYAGVTHIISVDEEDSHQQEATSGTAPERLSLTELERRTSPGFDYEASWRAVGPDDLLTIIFTSGTTGAPKGVELTHRNFIANAAILDDIGGAVDTDRIVSYLPDAHAANRFLAHYCPILSGITVTTVANADQIVDALAQTRPTLFLGVPRLWSKLANALTARIDANPGSPKARLARWALEVGRQHAIERGEGRTPGALLSIRYRLADALVLAKIRSSIGLDQCHLALTGAAPLAPETQLFILGLGVPLCAGWGMSEATTGLTVQRTSYPRLGTVGTPITGVELTVAEDGELLVRGEMVMRGYRKDPAQTAAAIDPDGWLHTGDLGRVEEDGEVRIIGRKKEIIVNAAGKNMSPSKIENAVAAHTPLAGYPVVIGDGRRYNTLLIGLDRDAANDRAATLGLALDDAPALASHSEVRQEIQRGVDAANATLSRTEQIKKFAIVPEFWEPGGAYVTPTMKLKRTPVESGYVQLVDDLYA